MSFGDTPNKPIVGISLHAIDLALQRVDYSAVKLKEIMDIQLLFLLSESPCSGYDLHKRMQKEFGETVSYGTLYPKLAYYERTNVLSSIWQRNGSENVTGVAKRKRVYKITEYGQEVLRVRLAELARMFRMT